MLETMKSIRTWLLVAVSCGLPLTAMAEEVMMPRGKQTYEQHLKELQDKYGAKDDDVLKDQAVAASTGEVGATQGVTSRAATSISGRSLKGVAPGSRLRIELHPVGADRFSFDDQSYDVAGLQYELEALAQTYQLDTLVLLEGGAPIQALHLVELSRLSATFKIPALYQRGETLLAVAAARRQ